MRLPKITYWGFIAYGEEGGGTALRWSLPRPSLRPASPSARYARQDSLRSKDNARPCWAYSRRHQQLATCALIRPYGLVYCSWAESYVLRGYAIVITVPAPPVPQSVRLNGKKLAFGHSI
uniref:Uncharacterized protein n=1 Tax=uncultured prokaryote TaxID=198431 RepID=A0A0H5Q7K1_9ZZZZ|nr:hypothetical protein [uncultured prokaryote]